MAFTPNSLRTQRVNGVICEYRYNQSDYVILNVKVYREEPSRISVQGTVSSRPTREHISDD